MPSKIKSKSNDLLFVSRTIPSNETLQSWSRLSLYMFEHAAGSTFKYKPEYYQDNLCLDTIIGPTPTSAQAPAYNFISTCYSPSHGLRIIRVFFIYISYMHR